MSVLAEDKTHASFHMGYGNKVSLDKADISLKVKQFYDSFYAKNKINILTIGRKDKLNIDKVAQSLQDAMSASTMKDKSEPGNQALKLNAPKTVDDTYIFLESKSEDHIVVLYGINIEPENLNQLTFLKVAFRVILDDILIIKNKLARKVDVGSDNDLSFAKIEFDIVPTQSGKKSPSVILAAIQDVIDNVHKYLKSYDKMALYIWKEYMLQPKGSNTIERLSPHLKNLWYFGLGKLFSGAILLQPYQSSVMRDILDQLKEVGTNIFYFGDFDREVGFKNDYDKVYTDAITRDTKLGADTSAKSVIKLDQVVIDHQIPYASYRVSRSKNRESINKAVGNNRLSLPEELPEKKFIPTDQVMKELLNYKPSKKYEVQAEKKANFTEIINDKYNLPSSSLHMLLNFDLEISKETYHKVSYWMSIIKFRLIPILIDTVSLRNQIGVVHDTTGLKISLNSLPGVGKDLLASLGSILSNTKVTKDEHEFALDFLFKKAKGQKSPFDDAKEAMARHMYVGSPNDAEKLQYIKDNANFVADKYDFSKLAIAKVHLEYSPGPGAITYTEVIEQFKDYPFKPAGFAFVKRQLPAENELLLIRVPKSNQAAANNGYLSCYLMGENNPKTNAIVFVLNRLLANKAFEYLRTEKKLGYVATTAPIRMHTDIALCLAVMGDKDIELTQKEMENFWTEASKLVASVTDDAVRQAANLLTDVNKSQFESLNAEALDKFDREIEGNKEDFRDKFLDEFKNIKKEDVVTEFDKYTKKSSKRIFAQSLPTDKVIASTQAEKDSFKQLNSQITIKDLLNV